MIRRIVILLFLGLAACRNPVQERVKVLVKDLESGSPAAANAALQELHDVGPDAAPAIPNVIRVLEQGHPMLRSPAAVTLAAIDPDGGKAIAPLIKALGDPSANARGYAAHAIMQLRGHRDEAVQALTALAQNDPDLQVRAFSASALKRIRPGNDSDQRILEDIFRRGKTEDRALCINLLSEAGPNMTDGDLQFVARGLVDRDAPVRAEAALGMGKAGAKAEFALPLLVRAFQDPDEMVNRKAIKAIMAVNPTGEKLVPLLRPSVRHKDVRVRLEAATALGSYGQTGLPAAKDLIGALADSDPLVRRQAARSLGRIGPDAHASEPLSRLLADLSDDTAWVAAEALARMGLDSLPFFKRALADRRPKLRRRAVFGLSKLDVKNKAVKALLAGAGKDSDEEVRNMAAAALK